jgi:hypothetical protein
MNPGENAGKDADEHPGTVPGEGTVDRYAEPKPFRPDAHPAVPPLPMREEDESANSLGLLITGALLFVLFTAALLFGGPGAIGPILHDAISSPGAKVMGNILYTIQDEPCPRMVFDEASTDATGGPETRCSKPQQWRGQSSTLP